MNRRSIVSLRLLLALLATLAAVAPAAPETSATWQRPPQPILDVLHAEDLPIGRLNPTGDVLALFTPLRYPPLADLAQPMLPLAGVRINPRTNGRRAEWYSVAAALLRVADGQEQKLDLPVDARVMDWQWSADGRRFAFLNQVEDGIELWVGETSGGRIRRIDGLAVNPILGSSLRWMPDQQSLLVKRIPPERGGPPERPAAPVGPKIQESSGGSAISTYEARDVLTGPYDEALFAHYALSQLVLVEAQSGHVRPLGEPGILAAATASPDGQWIMVERLQKPWSYSLGWNRFPRDIEILNAEGRRVHVAARLPLADHVPIHGEPEGPREHEWRPTEPATLVWLEALDGGDPGRAATHRDRVMVQRAPFRGEPREIYRAPHRVWGLAWGERDGLLLVFEYERERRWRHVWALHAD